MRVVIIGGSSFSTPSLIQFLEANARLEKLEVVLASRSAERLAAVGSASRLLARGNLTVTTEPIHDNNWKKLLNGADSVVIQIRVGGFKGRLFDETFPNKYGLCGDEGLGPGGLSAGWRTWPRLAPILDAIASFCPKTFVVLLTSPLSLLVRAALNHANLNLVGICELPWTTIQDLSQSLGLQAAEIQADYLGVNHMGWFFHIRSATRDLLDEVAGLRRSFPNEEFVRSHGCYPLRYLRMHYKNEKALAEQTSQKQPRANVLSDIQKRSYEAYKHGQADKIVSALQARETPWYSQAVGPLLLALAGQKAEIPFFLSKRNSEYVSFLAADDIVESQYRWAEGGLRRVPLLGAPPKHVVENLVPFVEFERVATEAIVSRRVTLLKDCLSVHPWVQDHSQLQSMVDEIVTANAALMAGTGG